MRYKKCNIWILEGSHAIVVPTNMGWRKDGRNVMGAGVAKQARDRCGNIPMIVGQFYKDYRRQWMRESMNTNPPILTALFGRKEQGQDGALVPAVSADVKLLAPYGWVEMVFVPSKKLVKPAYLSWKYPSDLRLVRRSLRRLKKIKTLREKIAVPLIGAGNGGLDQRLIEGTIAEILGDDERFTIVLPSGRY